ncbi:hypothetical protein PVAG01_04350 [Phlyctema vagabunda]|uniref:Uncharacterized protein n=1 Tax=Phlyctema vagabunda TaxID=108571 RepID=A0ABR4PP10_9HELO
MTSIIWWQAAHGLCILAHLGLIVCGFAAFAFAGLNLSAPQSVVTVPWALFGLGALGAQIHSILFYLLYRADQPLNRSIIPQSTIPLHPQSPGPDAPGLSNPSTETSETALFRLKIITLGAAIFNLFLFSADWALATTGLTVDKKYSSFLLKAVCLQALFSGATAFATIAADVLKLGRSIAHQRAIEQRDLDEIEEEYRDEEEGE